MIYLDNAATTRIHPQVLETMMPYLTEQYGNAGSLYKFGRQSADAVAKARKQVADLIGAEPENIIFTSGGSEANNLVFKGLEDYLREQGKTHIITTVIEHDSVIHATEALIKRHFDVTYLPVDSQCKVSVEGVREALRGDTGLVSVMYVNNETGAEQPIKEIAEICRENGILFATDCVQAVGFQDVNVEEIGCDFLSISGHKIHAPKGTGALYVRNKDLVSSLISGGEMQEFGLRGGTENVAGIVGFGKACEIADKYRLDNRHKINGLITAFFEKLKELSKDFEEIYPNGYCEGNTKVINLRIPGVDAETLILRLENMMCISAGSACRSLELKPSRVLKAMGLSDSDAYSSIRISFSEDNYIVECQRAAIFLARACRSIRGLSNE